MTNYSMTPIENRTRLRENHDVYSGVITSFNANDLLEGDELWEAPADGALVKKGDKWLRVLKRNGKTLEKPGWTAYIHLGEPICNNLRWVETTPPTEPPAPVSFPQSVVWEYVDSTGKTHRLNYVFERKLE